MLPRRAIAASLCSGLIAGAALIFAQAPDSDRAQPLEKQLARDRRLINDWGGLTRYGSDDAELPPPTPGEKRVVFFGDQITESWADEEPEFFRGKPWLDRGIAGQTTSQMLVRFRQDVIAVGAKAVLILAGTNDIEGVHGPATEDMILDNLASMADIAKAHGIRVILSSIPPVCDYTGKMGGRRRWQERIDEANEVIREYARKNRLVYADFYSALADGRDLKKALTTDGILLNHAGYDLLDGVATRAIAAALRPSR